MTPTVETVRLTETVGAEVRGVDVDRLLHDEDLPAWTHDALEANGVLVFRDLYIDDAAQVAFSKRLGRVEVESIRVVHTIEASQRRLVADPTPEQVAMWRSRPAKEQPLIWRHRDGRRSVVLGPTADHVVGMKPEEGQALLDDVLARATAPHHVHRHEWCVGDLVIWDNRGVLHRALPYDPGSPREMHRTTLHGNEAIQ
jgi:alpha-ketoglutarate-dependent taurine dioxygenase